MQEKLLAEVRQVTMCLEPPPPHDWLTLGLPRMQENTIAELRAVNGCLEREVGELEEDRRRLKAHLKFSAQHQGQIPVHLGLSPEQLTAINHFVQQLKGEEQVGRL